MKTELAAALLMENLVRSAYPEKRSSSVQPLQWSILRYVRSTEDEGRTLGAIARYVGVTAAPVSRAVATLEKRGLVSKSPSRENARAISIRITAKGLALLEDDPMLRLAHRLRELPMQDRRVFFRTLRALTLGAGIVQAVGDEGSSGH